MLNTAIALIAGSLPQKMRKMIVLSSLAGKVRHIKAEDATILEKLNKAMSLSKDTDALKLPIYLNARIWTKLDYERLKADGIVFTHSGDIDLCTMPTGQRKRLVNAFIEAMPGRMMYDSKTTMRRDMMRVLYQLSNPNDGAALAV